MAMTKKLTKAMDMMRLHAIAGWDQIEADSARTEDLNTTRLARRLDIIKFWADEALKEVRVLQAEAFMDEQREG